MTKESLPSGGVSLNEVTPSLGSRWYENGFPDWVKETIASLPTIQLLTFLRQQEIPFYLEAHDKKWYGVLTKEHTMRLGAGTLGSEAGPRFYVYERFIEAGDEFWSPLGGFPPEVIGGEKTEFSYQDLLGIRSSEGKIVAFKEKVLAAKKERQIQWARTEVLAKHLMAFTQQDSLRDSLNLWMKSDTSKSELQRHMKEYEILEKNVREGIQIMYEKGEFKGLFGDAIAWVYQLFKGLEDRDNRLFHLEYRKYGDARTGVDYDSLVSDFVLNYIVESYAYEYYPRSIEDGDEEKSSNVEHENRRIETYLESLQTEIAQEPIRKALFEASYKKAKADIEQLTGKSIQEFALVEPVSTPVTHPYR